MRNHTNKVSKKLKVFMALVLYPFTNTFLIFIGQLKPLNHRQNVDHAEVLQRNHNTERDSGETRSHRVASAELANPEADTYDCGDRENESHF